MKAESAAITDRHDNDLWEFCFQVFEVDRVRWLVVIHQPQDVLGELPHPTVLFVETAKLFVLETWGSEQDSYLGIVGGIGGKRCKDKLLSPYNRLGSNDAGVTALYIDDVHPHSLDWQTFCTFTPERGHAWLKADTCRGCSSPDCRKDAAAHD